MSNPDQPASTHAEFERVKARWYSDELHRPEFWADLASRDVPFLIGEVERLRGLLERLATETLLARAVIHELAWGQIPITEHPQLAATLRAWGEDDKIGTPEVKRLAGEST
jgi:hypothetical protein